MGWDLMWDHEDLHNKLSLRADTLQSLRLDNCLYVLDAQLDPRIGLKLNKLINLKYLHICDEWLYDLRALNFDPGSDNEETIARHKRLLPSILPQSLKDLTIFMPHISAFDNRVAPLRDVLRTTSI